MLDGFLLLLILCLSGVAIKFALDYRKIRNRFADIVDADEELARVKKDIQKDEARYKKSVEKHQSLIDELSSQYLSGRTTYERLKKELSLLEESLEDLSYGLYKPHYNFDDPERFKAELQKIYNKKKDLIKEGRAVNCPQNWTVNGSTREGAKMIKQESKLMLRAFNGEADAAIAKVNWTNAPKMEERIRKTFEAVNALGSVMNIFVTTPYMELAIAELRLTHELEVRKQEVKEEQKAIREQMREEEQAQREFEKAKKAAEAEEIRFQRALETARRELEVATAAQQAKVAAKIDLLEQQLSEAQGKLERAVSMAQLTKSGHVYVISNIGSFGDDVFKIGMTRRLDPTERVYELGSASVPFPYDIHAMIYTADAPGLELAFHREFAHRRVNMVNHRKEFFRISLDEIEKFALTHHSDIQFTKLAEAREYRETREQLEKLLQQIAEPLQKTVEIEDLPQTLTFAPKKEEVEV